MDRDTQEPLIQRIQAIGTGDTPGLSPLTDQQVRAVMRELDTNPPVRTEVRECMELEYQPDTRSRFHIGCEGSKFKSGIITESIKLDGFSVWKCGHCEKAGLMPHGVNSAVVPVLSTHPPVRAEVREVLDEVARATRKFPTWPTDPLHAIAVLGEEFGELTKAALQLMYEPGKSTHDAVREEAVQTAAMALRLLMSLDQYDYAPRPQHSQNAALGVEHE